MILIFHCRFDDSTVVGKVEKGQVQSLATSMGPLFDALTGLPLNYNMNLMEKEIQQRRCCAFHISCPSLIVSNKTILPSVSLFGSATNFHPLRILNIKNALMSFKTSKIYQLIRNVLTEYFKLSW
jgi:hypothetical protein